MSILREPPVAESDHNDQQAAPARPRVEGCLELPSLHKQLPEFVQGPGASHHQPSQRRQRLSPRPPRLIRPLRTYFDTTRQVLLLDGKPCTEYQIVGLTYTMQKAENEEVNIVSRETVDGRTLTYRLKVVQQPEKARACGAGPRSSADRRPVDPPPVVRLTIYDGDKDITMRYDAGFMLYASLDCARPIAHGRLAPFNNAPVLTGVAVASIAYLEKPKPAGYFIFPDLSVRHEGWYRLKFHLFEQVKHADDADKDRPFPTSQRGSMEEPTQPCQHEAMANRMFVSSTPFQVFSAKKFPGLSTSTTLSRIVAEQGCRVRIRREIRQRRTKKGKDGEEDEHRSIHGTPEPLTAHSRDGSVDRSRRISLEAPHLASRRPSMDIPPVSTPVMAGTVGRTPLSASSPITPGYQQQEARTLYRPEIEHRSYACPPPPPPQTAQHIHGLPPPQTGATLPSISSLVGDLLPTNVVRPRAYETKEFTPKKRSFSPRMSSLETSLKDGARPDAILSRQKSASTIGWVMNPEHPHLDASHLEGGYIEPDDDNSGSNSDSEDSILNGPLVYKRADGTKIDKPLIALRGL